MAPFKLKFRMGSSRSTSQEVDTDPQVNQSLLNNSNVGVGASNSTIDSVDFNSIGSLSNDQRSLLRNCNSNERIGYLNPTLTQSIDSSIIPSSPPPSYEHVLGENRLASLDRDPNQTPTRTNRETCGSVRSLIQISSVEHLNNTCTDPDCKIVNDSNQTIDGTRRESIGSREYLVSTMTTPSSHDNLLECTCDPLFMSHSQEQINCGERERLQFDGNEQPQQQHQTSSQQQHQQHQHQQQQQQQQQNQRQESLQQEQDTNQEHQQCMSSGDEDDNYSDGDWSQQASNVRPQNTITTSEIISNKSSKEIYKAVAKQWGITCKMSDQCRCMECQSHYFDCEFDENEPQQIDGGLNAGTPIIISEVMQGIACTIL